MSPAEILDLLDRVAATGSRDQKYALLKAASDDMLLRQIVLQTYHPQIQYYQKKVPEASAGADDFDGGTLLMLNSLSERIVTGAAAKKRLHDEMARLNAPSQTLLARIIGRDLRIGIAKKGIEACFPGLVPVFDVMLAEVYHPTRISSEMQLAVSPKLDGMRVIAKVDQIRNTVEYYSRNGNRQFTLDHISDSLLQLDTAMPVFWVDGETTAGSSFAESISAAKKRDSETKATFNAFDLLPFEMETDEPLGYRWSLLAQAVANTPIQQTILTVVPHYAASGHEEIMAAYAQYRQDGYEGCIVKDWGSGYRKRRTFDWMKIKPNETLDLPIVGAFEGQGKYIGMLGGFTVLNGAVEVNIGAGYSDKDRRHLWAIWQTDPSQLLGKLIEVSFHEKTPDGSLRHPRAKRFRLDKSA